MSMNLDLARCLSQIKKICFGLWGERPAFEAKQRGQGAGRYSCPRARISIGSAALSIAKRCLNYPQFRWVTAKKLRLVGDMKSDGVT